MLRKKIVLLILLCLPLLSYAGELHDLRNRRYCEIITHERWLSFAVYNTIHYNNCPQELWKNITEDTIKEQTHSSVVILNGPRYFIVDGVQATPLETEPTTLSGLQMQKVAVLHLSMSDLFNQKKPYKTHVVDRETTWFFNAGKPVYELIDPNGLVFVMQSYCVPQATLATLCSTLHLPSGWQCRSGLLKTDTTLKAILNQATVTQDNYFNTYQLAAHDFLK